MVPFKYLAQSWLKGGKRLSPRPKPQSKYVPVVHDYRRFGAACDTSGKWWEHGYGKRYEPPPKRQGPSMLRVSQGNLQNADYRYWWGASNEVSMFAKCKCCGMAVIGTPERRKKHFEEKGCANILTRGLKFCLREGKCIVCGDKTATSKWGTPLHDMCIHRWMFDDISNYPLLKEVVERGRRELML